MELWPVLEGLDSARHIYPKRMNAAAELLDKAVADGFGARPCLHGPDGSWAYAELLEKANRIAGVLTNDLGLVPGNRVLLRSPNNPMLAAAWLGVIKAGGIVVATMPLLRAPELSHIIAKAEIEFAICDARLASELQEAAQSKLLLTRPALKTVYSNDAAPEGLEARMARQPAHFQNVIASHDDVALIAFTSGTTGSAKATMHFHRDLLAICDYFPGAVFDPKPDDVFAGSAPFAFTFGLGALLLFPLRFGASSILLEQAKPDRLIAAIEKHRASILFTVPTLYRAMTPLTAGRDLSALRICISSGEHLPQSVLADWKKATGCNLLNSIGSTEMLHAFLAMRPDDPPSGAVGRPLPGFRARIVDESMRDVAPGEVGRLAVRGPTGCRYLDDERQKKYVRDGWNLSGDAFRADADGNFWYHARTDDMIISAGYNISGCRGGRSAAAAPERARMRGGRAERWRARAGGDGFCGPADGAKADGALTQSLQDFVKSAIAPYKYPRVIEYLDALPRTTSGKIQRHVLRDASPR